MRIDTTILGATSLLAIAMGGTGGTALAVAPPPAVLTETMEPPVVAGTWRSLDGAVTLVLRRDRSYDLTVRGRDRTSHGSYAVDGADVRLHDDDGLRTPARITGDGLIEMAGHELFPV